jgi:hypothetical protein
MISLFQKKEKSRKWLGFKYIWFFAFIATLAFTMGCSKKSSPSPSNNNNASGADTVLTSVQIATVTGTASSSIVKSSISTSTLGTTSIKTRANVTADCTTCEAYGVGLGLLSGSGGCNITDSSTGAFTANINKDFEAILKFTCPAPRDNMRCFVKANDTGIVCDPLADAVVSSLEEELSASLGATSVETSTLFRGLSIAKIAQGMIETLKLIVALDPTNDMFDKIIAAAGDKSALKSIISESPVGTLFKAIAEAAKTAVINNQTNSTSGEQMSVEALVNLIAGMGMTIEIDPSVTGTKGPGLYSDLMGSLDELTNTSFMANLKLYLLKLYDITVVKKEASPVAMICMAENNNSGTYIKPLTYAPRLDTVNNRINCDNAYIPGTWTEVRISLLLKPSFTENDRNDPTGEHKSNEYSDFRISYISTMKEFDTGLQQYMQDNNTNCGLNTTSEFKIDDNTVFKDCMVKADLAKYFTGLLGIYVFQNNPTQSVKKFSLNDIHNSISESVFMVGQTPNGGGGLSIPVTYTENGQDINGEAYFPQLVQELPTLFNATTNTPTFQLKCPTRICADGVNPDKPVTNFTGDELKTFLSAYKLTYNSTMKMFEQIPTMDEIKKSIFQDAHHEDWNIMGSEKFYINGVPESSNPWQAVAPILCKISNADSSGNFIRDTSSVSCIAANDVTWVNGKVSGVNDYGKYTKGYLGLQDRSRREDPVKYYSLVNLGTGWEIYLNGRQFRVKHEAGANGKTTGEIQQKVCDQSGHCWEEDFIYVVSDLTALLQTETFRPFSIGKNVTVTFTDWSSGQPVTQSYDQWRDMAMSNKGTATEYSDDLALCLTESALTSALGTQDTTEVVNVANINWSGNPVNCDSTGNSFYYLTLSWQGGTADRTNYKYGLLKNDGTNMHMVVDNQWYDGIIPLATVALYAEANLDLGITDLDNNDAHLYPAGDVTYMPGFEIANLKHESKFDPYCDDVDMNGRCDCYKVSGVDANGLPIFATSLTSGGTIDTTDIYGITRTAGNCTIEDKGGSEPTLSDRPYWNNSGDPNNAIQIQILMNVMDTCGSKTSDSDLSTCLGTSLDTNVPADFNKLFACKDSSKTMKYVNLGWMKNGGNPSETQNPGDGCGTVDPWNQTATGGTYGPVRFRKLIARNNAYNVSRPQTLMKMIATATQTIGTGGGNITSTDLKFSLNEAMAMMLVRLSMPVNGIVIDKDNMPIANVGVHYERVWIPGTGDNDPIGYLLGIAVLQK